MKVLSLFPSFQKLSVDTLVVEELTPFLVWTLAQEWLVGVVRCTLVVVVTLGTLPTSAVDGLFFLFEQFSRLSGISLLVTAGNLLTFFHSGADSLAVFAKEREEPLQQSPHFFFVVLIVSTPATA